MVKNPEAEVVRRILELKEEQNALIIAHNYQIPEIQDIADYVGDSFELSRKAAHSDEDVIVFCGVNFMAETAKILAPEKTVLLPAEDAGCPLADTIDAEQLRAKKEAYPDAAVVCYVNSSAEVKAESDICCTSSNAVNVVNSLKEDRVIFVPDGNLASWTMKSTNKQIIPWQGNCVTHHRVRQREVAKIKEAYPDAVVMAHPECRPEVLELADVVTSTSGMIRYAQSSDKDKFIIGTEVGHLYALESKCPDKEFFLLSTGLVCPDMKKISSLEMVLESLENKQYEIEVPKDVREKAYSAVKKMLEII